MLRSLSQARDIEKAGRVYLETYKKLNALSTRRLQNLFCLCVCFV